MSVVFRGITNPGTAGQQTLAVTTTADQDSASTQYTVVAANPITAVTVDNTAPSRAAGARTQYVVGFTTSATGGGMSGAANSRIDVTFPTGTAFPGCVSATVRNLTTATNVGSCCNPSGLVIQCSLFSSTTIGAGHNVAITFNGITNPATAAADKRATVATTSDPQPVDSAQFTVVAASPITAVTVDNTAPSQGGRRPHPVRRRLHHLRHRRRHVRRRQQPHRRHLPRRHHLRRLRQRHRTQPHHRHQRRQLRQRQRPRDPVHAVLVERRSAPATTSRITFDGITNPATGAPTSASTVSTTVDPQPVDSAPFDVVAASPITAVTVDNTTPSRAAGARTQYVVGFTTSATGGGMSGAANSRIDVTFPTGTTFAGYVSATVRNLTTATNVGSCGSASGLVIQCYAVLRRTPIGAGHNVAITFDGITNPPFQGTDNRVRVSTTSDTQTVDSAQFGVLAGQSLTAVTVEPGEYDRVGDHAVRRALRHLELRAASRAPPTAGSRSRSPRARRSAATRTRRSTT